MNVMQVLTGAGARSRRSSPVHLAAVRAGGWGWVILLAGWCLAQPLRQESEASYVL